jgi:polyisoprenoid-binding protein YceI
MQRMALAFALSVAFGAVAQAAEYSQVQADKSRIAFSYTQMGVTMDGHFKTFSSQLSFDPAQPAKAKAVIDVDLASVDTGTTEGDDEVAGKQWFNTPVFPTARFESGSVKALGDNHYEVAGKLTIKGQTRDILVPASFTAQGPFGVFDGTFTIRRGDFAIGEGSWSAFDVVANDVQIKFQISAASGS